MATSFVQRVIASADAFTGLVVAANGAIQKVASDSLGRLWGRVFGDTPHDSPDNTNANANYPVKIGGYAAGEAPNLVATGDRVNGYFDQWGRQQVNFEKAIAGENLALNILRTMRGKVPVEQESWSDVVINNVTGQVIKGSAGRLGRIQILNTSATALFVLVHDSTAFGTLGPILWRGWVPAAAAGTPGVLEMDFTNADGLYFEIGISFSTSTGVAAIAGAVAVYGNALYV